MNWKIRIQDAAVRADLRYGLRVLTRSRGFAALAILTMAVGIGIMTTVFSLIHGVLLKPLPWPEPERLVRLSETHQGATRRLPWIMTNAAFLAWRDQPSTIEQLAAWSRRQATITGAGDAERLSYAVATASVFSLLQARPLIGVTFGTEDEAAALPVGKIILSYGLWQQRFGGNPQVLGQSISLDGKAHTIIGVMPREFAFPDRETRAWASFYIPPIVTPDGQGRALSMFDAMARLKPGVTPEQAAAEATARVRSGPDPGLVAMAVFGSNGPAEITAVPALQAITAEIRGPLIMMLVAVALLLVTATANIAGLQLARANTRRREIAIRAAIGAGTRRITQQLLAENVLLGLAGGTAGLILTATLHRLLPSLLPADFPRLDNVALNWTVASFSMAVTLVTGVLLGTLPALHLRRLKLTEALLENGTTATSGTRSRVPQTRMAIMVGQIAIACTLLTGAGLLIRSFVAMMNADRGYRAANVLTTRVAMPDGLFTPQRRLELLDALLERVRLLPGVTRIAFTTGLPLSGSETLSSFTMNSLRPPIGAEIEVSTTRSVVTEEYFAAMGMRATEGRTFNSSDTAISPKVVVVSRSFARQYLSDKPIGDRISNFARGDGEAFEVVGIVEDVVKRGLSDPIQPEIYSLDRQMTTAAFNPNGGSLVLNAAGDPQLLIDPLKRAARALDPSIVFSSIMTMDDRLSSSLARPRLYAVLLGILAVSALVISSVGLFGVLSYSVSQRTREIAVRTALGATPRAVIGLVLRQGLVVVIIGTVIGLLTSLAFMKYLSTLLYGVSSYDWVTFMAVSMTISVLALVACIVPAVRAARIDPLTAMRA